MYTEESELENVPLEVLEERASILVYEMEELEDDLRIYNREWELLEKFLNTKR